MSIKNDTINVGDTVIFDQFAKVIAIEPGSDDSFERSVLSLEIEKGYVVKVLAGGVKKI
jgi:hypothetical protein